MVAKLDMASKKGRASGKSPKKAVPAESPAETVAARKSVLPDDRVILAVMAGGVILGFLLYLLFLKIAPLVAAPAIGVEDVQFLADEGEIHFTILNQEETPNACQAVVLLFSDGTQILHKAVDAGILESGSSRVVSLEADIPAGKFDYDIQVSCTPAAEG